MDNKFLLALVWIMGAAVVATLVYSTWDLLRWLTARVVSCWRFLAIILRAGHAMPVGAGRLIRIKSR